MHTYGTLTSAWLGAMAAAAPAPAAAEIPAAYIHECNEGRWASEQSSVNCLVIRNEQGWPEPYIYIYIYIYLFIFIYTYMVYTRYFWQEIHQIYGHIQCICTVLASLSYQTSGLDVLSAF
jgi:hypothetical protein